MKNNLVNLSLFCSIFFLISCSSPENAPFADSSNDEDITVEITSRSLDEENTSEDIYGKIAQKWVSDSGTISMEIKSDNSFAGTIDGGKTINGAWKLSEDLKSIVFLVDQEKNDAGSDFNATYTIVELSPKKLILHNQDNNKILSFS
ncbi:MAG: hypothetical protein MK207_06820 [Saprospiraceae bacterium]|nr:hypothetical protein [Saprospiraceae bacterium]